MTAEWRPIAGFGDYEVSDLGEVRSWKVCRRLPGPLPRKMVGGFGTKGYLQVVLCRDGKQFSRHVHRLVLEAFVGPCPSAMEACHQDGDRTNNRADNLRWDTRRSNHSDKVTHGTAQRGERASNVKLTSRQVLEIRNSAGSMASIARMFGVSCTTVRGIRRGRLWAWLDPAAQEAS